MNAPMLIPMPVEDPLPMAWLDTNDLGNAERLVRLAKGLLLWVEELGWVGYDGKRWSARDGERMASRLAHDVARHIDREARALDQLVEQAAKHPDAIEKTLGVDLDREIVADRCTALRKHAVKSGDASRTAAMLVQARTLLAARREDFDKDKLAFNLQNGTLRFVPDGEPSPDPTREGRKVQKWTFRVDQHEPADMIMQLAGFTFDREADCPQWKARLAMIQPEPDQRRLLQVLYGYCLTGLISEQKWFIHQGRGGDGKSVTNMAIAGLMADYYRHADIKTFLEGAQKSGSDHSSDLARLQGDIRLVTCDEPKAQSTWNSSTIKQVTGGTITCRPLRREEIEYVARWKLIVEVNPLPKVPSDDDGFWRRCRPIPWEYQFDKGGGEASEPMEIVIERLTAEASGILNWMIRGGLKWLGERRLPESAKAKELFDAYRSSASPFGQWLIERGDTSDKTAITAASVLYADFKAFCEGLGLEKVPTQTFFGTRLRDLQCHVVKDPYTGNANRRGIKLRPDGMGGALGGSTASGAGGRAAEPRGPQDDIDLDGRPVEGRDWGPDAP